MLYYLERLLLIALSLAFKPNSPYADFSDEDQIVITPAVTLKNMEGDLVGVAAVDFDMTSVVSTFDKEVSRAPTGSVSYIMDSSDEHLLIVSSIPGTAYDKDGAQLSAIDSSNAVIKDSAIAVSKSADASKVFVADVDGEKSWVQAIEVSEIGTLPFEGGVNWLFVYVQAAVCEKGLVLDEATAECVAKRRRLRL